MDSKAKAIIADIVRQSTGDELEGKTRLFKAFYFAHLYYARANSDYLSEWPIVRMPRGPGIEDFDTLLSELESERVLEVFPETDGPYPTTVFRYIGRADPALSDAEKKSVMESVKYISKKTGARLSSITHEKSRSWRESVDGDELDIYIDLLSESEYKAIAERNDRISSALDGVL